MKLFKFILGSIGVLILLTGGLFTIFILNEDLIAIGLSPFFWLVICVFVASLLFLRRRKTIPFSISNKWQSRILSFPYWLLFLLFLAGIMVSVSELSKFKGFEWIYLLFDLGGTPMFFLIALGIWRGKAWGYVSGLIVNSLLILGFGFFLVWLFTRPDPCMGDYECWGPAVALVFYIPILAIGIPTSIFLWKLKKQR